MSLIMEDHPETDARPYVLKACGDVLIALLAAIVEHPDKVKQVLTIGEHDVSIELTFEIQADCARFIGHRGSTLSSMRRIFHKIGHRHGYSRLMFTVVDPKGRRSSRDVQEN